MCYAGLDELELDSADAAVVHVRGSDAVGACLGVRHRDVADALDGELVVEGAVFAQDAAVAVGGVFAEADVGGDEEGGEGFAEEADRGDDGALRVVGCGAEGILCGGLEGNAEEDHGAETLGDEGAEEWDELIDAPSVLPGQGGDQGLLVGIVGYEEGVDQHRFCELALRLPGAREGVRVASVKLRADVAGYGDGGGGGADVGARAGDRGLLVVGGLAIGVGAVTVCEVGDQGGERHRGDRWRGSWMCGAYAQLLQLFRWSNSRLSCSFTCTLSSLFCQRRGGYAQRCVEAKMLGE